MQGSHASAMAHIESGAKLLREAFNIRKNAVSKEQVTGLKVIQIYTLLSMFWRVFSQEWINRREL